MKQRCINPKLTPLTHQKQKHYKHIILACIGFVNRILKKVSDSRSRQRKEERLAVANIHRKLALYRSSFESFLREKNEQTGCSFLVCEKRYFTFLSMDLNQITPKGVHIINAKHCISSRRSLVYHHCERGYSLRLMIYTFGDEIHAKA